MNDEIILYTYNWFVYIITELIFLFDSSSSTSADNK